jgi:hypothetical protein
MFAIIKMLSRAALALAFALLALPASAQYPDRPVKLVVGFAAGGFTRLCGNPVHPVKSRYFWRNTKGDEHDRH